MCAFEFSTSVRFGSLWTHDMEVMKTEHVSIWSSRVRFSQVTCIRGGDL